MTPRDAVVRNRRPSRGQTAARVASTGPAEALDLGAGFRSAHVLPDPESFAALHRRGKSVPVMLELDDPGWDPLDLVEALPSRTTTYVLETPGGPADLNRRTFVAWEPEQELILRRGWLETWSADERVGRKRCLDPIRALREYLARAGAQPLSEVNGFCGGLIGYIGYDFKNYLERLPDRVADDLETPDLRLGFVRRVVSWNHREKKLRLCVNVLCNSTRAQQDRLHAIDELQALLAQCQLLAKQSRSSKLSEKREESKLQSNFSRSSYARMFARTREHILAGDIYQANVSQRFEARFNGSGLQLYRYLRGINPSPFAVYMRFPQHEIVSCSPERLVRLEGRRVETRPIAGTRPRGASAVSDRRLEMELLASDKERAEHLMIVDMARNDIGRVCVLGSVAVESFMAVERYSHVRHLVSNIVGRLQSRHDALDLLAATFPGASITGVPKVRCMQIIDELEPVRRGVYTGSAGYFGLGGSLDLNILIRTFFVQNGTVYFSVGGGIVADSDPGHEYAETLAKGKALQEALRAVTSDGAARVDRRASMARAGAGRA